MVESKIKTAYPQTHVQSLAHLLSSDLRNKDKAIFEIADHFPVHVNWWNRRAKTTFVTFSAAAVRDSGYIPIFTGINTAADLNANVLMLSDLRFLWIPSCVSDGTPVTINNPICKITMLLLFATLLAIHV